MQVLLVLSFCHLASIILCALILSETLALYKSFTYLLGLCFDLSWNLIFKSLRLGLEKNDEYEMKVKILKKTI